jgi:hypothetical protein
MFFDGPDDEDCLAHAVADSQMTVEAMTAATVVRAYLVIAGLFTLSASVR